MFEQTQLPQTLLGNIDFVAWMLILGASGDTIT